MQKFIDDNWHRFFITFLISLFIWSLLSLFSLTSHFNKYKLCIDAKMQYIDGNCVTQENKNGK